MPIYEYRCEANGHLVEVRHGMNERLTTWGELCARAGISRGATAPGAAVVKLISAGFIGAGSSEPAVMSDCGSGGCGAPACAGGACAAEDF